MLIEALLDFLALLFDLLLTPLQMDVLPEQIALTVTAFLTYFATGVAIIAEYTHFAYLLILLSVCVIVDTVHTLYISLMWVLRKIPFLNIH